MNKFLQNKGYEELIKSIGSIYDKSKLIVSKYQLFLPDVNELKLRVKEIMENK